MKKYFSIISISILFSALFIGTSLSAETEIKPENDELGISYARQERSDIDLYHFELYWRKQLPLNKSWGDWKVKTKLEFATAYMSEENNNDTETVRLSLMPQLIFQYGAVGFVAGFGCGVMLGDTEYPDHDLGGRFLLNSKLAMQYAFTEKFGGEFGYYHQSNARIYNHNASLNMAFVSLAWYF